MTSSLHLRELGRQGRGLGELLYRRVKGKRTKDKGLGNVLDETEAKEVAPVAGDAPDPVRHTEVHRSVVPGTAPDHASVFRLFVKPARTPLPHISRHVVAAVEADSVGILGFLGGMPNPGLNTITLSFVELLSPGIQPPVFASGGFFPFLFGGEALASPCGISLCLVVTDTDYRMIHLVPFHIIPMGGTSDAFRDPPLPPVIRPVPLMAWSSFEQAWREYPVSAEPR